MPGLGRYTPMVIIKTGLNAMRDGFKLGLILGTLLLALGRLWLLDSRLRRLRDSVRATRLGLAA